MTTLYHVGIDVALQAHRVAVLGPDGEAVGASFTIESTSAGVATLVRTLAARGADPARALIGVEATGHFWENLHAQLTRAGYRVVVLNPLQTRRYRDVLRKKAKTDDIDAYVIAGLLRSGEAQASYVPDEPIQSLRELARLRARLMRERQTYLRQLGAQLGVVFPEHKDALGDLLTARARGVLRAYPTAQHLAGATPRAIHHAAHSAGARGFTVEDATRVRDLARQSIYSGKAALARGNVVRTLVTQIERLLVALEELDAAMVAELPQPPVGGGPSDADLLQSLPGVGAHTVATLLGELGTLSRFTSGKALVAYVGFYPTLEQSGQRTAVARLVALGSRIARRALYLTAVNAIRGSAEWRTLYVRKTAQGKKPKQALIVVAVKLLHTMYAMLRDRRPYNAARLLVAPMAAA
jgi:transposase